MHSLSLMPDQQPEDATWLDDLSQLKTTHLRRERIKAESRLQNLLQGRINDKFLCVTMIKSFRSDSLLRLSLFHHLANVAFERILPSEPQPSASINHHVVEYDESTEDSQVPPFVGVIYREAPTKFITICILTELTNPISTSLNITTSLLNECLCIALTSLTWRCIKSCKLRGLTNHRLAVNRDSQHSFEEIMERCQPIHP